MSVDNMNHPEYYETNGIECFDAILASQGEDSAKEFCICNAFKYIWRNKHKDSSVEDIKKAIWYLNKFVELSEGAKTNGASCSLYECFFDESDVSDIPNAKNLDLPHDDLPFWHNISRNALIEACYILKEMMGCFYKYYIPDANGNIIQFRPYYYGDHGLTMVFSNEQLEDEEKFLTGVRELTTKI